MRSRGVFCAHEADARQRVGWSGEGQGTVQVAGPDRVAEWSGGPQAAGVAKDRLTRQKTRGTEHEDRQACRRYTAKAYAKHWGWAIASFTFFMFKQMCHMYSLLRV